MTDDQFRVLEHFSYDMIGTGYYERFRNPLNTKSERMMEFLIEGYVVTPIYCELRLFPDYEFNAEEFAKR